MNKTNLVIPTKKYDKEQRTLQRCSIEIYEETADYNFDEVIKKIKSYCDDHNGSYAIMRHDKDIYVEDTFNSKHQLVGTAGEAKKTHYHALIDFNKRVGLNDIALAFGIEDRWIKILRTERDFNNMIVYATHIKYDESEKHHYDVDSFDSNIKDYCQFLYNKSCEWLERTEECIYMSAVNFLRANAKYIVSYEEFVSGLLSMEFELEDIRHYYMMLKDLLIEHNQRVDVDDAVDRMHMNCDVYHDMEKKKFEDSVSAVCDTFGSSKLELGNNTYFITKLKKKGGK